MTRWLFVALIVCWCRSVRAEPLPHVAIHCDDPSVAASIAKALVGKAAVVDGEDPELAATLTVEIATLRRKIRAVVVVVAQGSDEAERGRLKLRGTPRDVSRAIERKLWPKLGKAILGAKHRAPIANETVVPAEPDLGGPSMPLASTSRPATSGERHEAREDLEPVVLRVEVVDRRSRPPIATFSVSGRPFSRVLSYRDNVQAPLHAYDIRAFAVAGAVALWPLGRQALFVELDGELAVGIDGSTTTSGMAYTTHASEWSAHLGYALGRFLRVDAAYGEQRFSIEDGTMAQDLVPAVRYRWLRPGLTATAPFSRNWTASAAFGFRYLVSTGDLAAAGWFPRSTGNGIDGAISVRYRLSQRLGLGARVGARRYFFAMNPKVGDPWIAGGAIDQYIDGAVQLDVSIP
jgi:hypothetical protein